MTSPPAFIDISEPEQAVELCKYFEAHGANLKVPENASCSDKIIALAKNCGVCLKADISEEDGQMCMNSIFSLFHIVSADQLVQIVQLLCEQIATEGEKPPLFRMNLLKTLFGMLESSPVRATIWLHMLEVAKKGNFLESVTTDLDVVRKWLEEWSCGRDVVRKVLRSLHDALRESGQASRSTKVLVELLTTADDDSHQSRDDAHQCIVASILDPATFLMDHLISLRAVTKLEGELIHDLLKIFVSGSYQSYMKFYSTNADFVDRLGLSHESNQQKMRLLTLLSLCSKAGEIPMATVEQDLVLDSMGVESLVIDAIRTKLLQAKIDQLQKKIVVSSSLQRTFDKQQWEYLRSELERWRKNLHTVRESVASMSVNH